MELIYLWVEEYKNIHKQGFNFSPKFECRFDHKYENVSGKEKLKDDCILDIKQKKHVEEFFGKDINLTAIVGENGSGKSNILEALSDYCSDKKLIIKVFYDGTKILYKTNKNIKINTTASKENISEHTILYTEIPSDNSIENQKITNISLWNTLQKNDYGISKSLSFIKNEMQTSHMILMKIYDFLPGVNKRPAYIEFSFNHHYFDNVNYKDIDKIWVSILQILIERDIDKYKDGRVIEEYLTDDEDLSIKDVTRFIMNNIVDEETFDWLGTLQDLTQNFVTQYKLLLKYDTECVEQTIPINDVSNETEYDEIRTFKLFIRFRDFSEALLHSIEDLFSYSREELIINLKWDITLSMGEESFLNLFASLYNCIKKYGYSFQHINIIVDEIEAYLHPNWQTQFIDLLIKFFKLKGVKYSGKTNIILTSHSPFVLSDIPKENVVFLEKGQQVYPFGDGQQTFGANIHTLLSHGFFMRDGLMGEFAKEKINRAIGYLNKKILTQEEINYCDNIISIIGEPILRRQLQKMLDSKRLSEIEQIKKQIEELQKELEKKEDKK